MVCLPMEINDEYDPDMITIGIIGIIIFIIGVILAVTWLYHVAERPYDKICRENPLQRYAQPCDNYDNCVSLCTKRLRQETKN